jgi:hypothetical protein
MKKIIFTLILCVFTISLFAQLNSIPVNKPDKIFFPLKDMGMYGPDTLVDHFPNDCGTQYRLYHVAGGGYMPGINANGDIAHMQRVSCWAPGIITNMLFGFAYKEGSGAVTACIWSDSSGMPGTKLGSAVLHINSIDTNTSDPYFIMSTSVSFSPPISIPANLSFWAGLEYYNSSPGDTIGLIMGEISSGGGLDAFIQLADSSLHSVFDYYGLQDAFAVFPVIKWIPSYGIIQGNVFNDANGNGIKDINEFGIPGQIFKADTFYATSDNNGDYLIGVDDSNSYVVKHIIQGYLTSSPDSIIVSITTPGMTSSGNDFACRMIPGVRDLTVSIASMAFRPGFQSLLWLNYSNMGAQPETGTLKLNCDNQLNFQSSIPPPDSINGNSITWNFSSLMPGEGHCIDIWLYTPTSDSIGTNLMTSASILPVVNDTNFLNNYDTIYNVVTGSYDPNEKDVMPVGDGSQCYIGFSTNPLEYTIHFQNTGTDTAFTVVIKDTIDANLDFGTFRLLGSSHPCIYSLLGNSEMTFSFNNILLPDSNTNQTGSNGFVKYSIAPKSGLPSQTEITNTAFIYFDYNAAVATNTTLNTVGYLPGIQENLIGQYRSYVYPNPFKKSATLVVDSKIKLSNAMLEIYDLLGNVVFTKRGITTNLVPLDMVNLKSGIYFYRLTDDLNPACIGKIIVD